VEELAERLDTEEDKLAANRDIPRTMA